MTANVTIANVVMIVEIADKLPKKVELLVLLYSCG